jgi:hypothetical protein
MARNLQTRKRREIRARSRCARVVGIAVACINQAEADASKARLLATLKPKRRLIAAVFYSTIPLAGFKDWWLISGIPVELSRHTRSRCMTGLVMSLGARSES